LRIFVSYARRDRGAVDALLQDIRRARHDVWVDEELTGGQSWWDTILGTIRGADLFVVALSPDWLGSKACAAELHYAVACNRAVLPIMVSRVAPQMAPPVIANAQILDYLERTADAAISLVTAIATARPAGQLPQPLPVPPPVPMSYMNTYREQIDQLSLSFQQQSMLLGDLRAHLADDDDRDSATELIKRLRRRGDITESVGKEIDVLLATSASTTTDQREVTTTSTFTATPPGWYPDPSHRYERRYWDGTQWTDHAARGGQQIVDPLTPVSQQSAATTAPAHQGAPETNSEAKWDAGTFVGLLIVSLIPCIGVIGVIVGAINLKRPARRSQALVLLIIGIITTVAVLVNANFNSGSDFGLRVQ
jgi:hypothetical protein